ncbi:MAG: DUF2085 domain-containing protein [Candidatus Poseidoniaceae archaeon]|nr:DUF2085 domain-containing protein [Candidatus Poseidoniaceae archaeon]
MNKNGLPSRDREKKVGNWVFYISSFFLVSFFVAPLMLAPGEIPELNNGRANAFDFATNDGMWSSGNTDTNATFAWTELDPYTGFIYAFGDLNCHNKPERSIKINDNQMPVCTRDVGIFFGLAVGGFWFSRKGYNRWTVKDTCLSLLPDAWLLSTYQANRRTLVWIGCGLILCLPLLVDGFTQLLTPYESNNITRPITGAGFGVGLGVLISAAYSARSKFFKSAAQVNLPGGMKFRLVEEE